MTASTGARFAAPYDTVTKVISAAFCAFLLAAAISTHSMIAVTVVVPLIVLAYAYSPRAYTVSNKSVIVHRLVGDVNIPLENARELRSVGRDDLRGCMRLWGSGGLFGYYGLFRTSKFGKCTWYATDRKKLVVLIGERKTTIYSPDDVDGFLAAVRQEVLIPLEPAPRDGTSSTTSSWIGSRFGPRIAIGIALLMACAGVLAALFATRFSPGLPRYTLTRDQLTIHDRFYPVTLKAESVDVDGIRVIDLDTDPDWIPEVGTNGFSNAHYHSGWYRVRNGTKVRLYRANGDRLVYLPSSHGDAPVLLDASDPDRLASEIESEWQRRK